jgi:hypothetical protein
MWDPNMSRVHETRDVIWMKGMFYSKPAIQHDFAVFDEDNLEISILLYKAGVREKIQKMMKLTTTMMDLTISLMRTAPHSGRETMMTIPRVKRQQKRSN